MQVRIGEPLGVLLNLAMLLMRVMVRGFGPVGALTPTWIIVATQILRALMQLKRLFRILAKLLRQRRRPPVR